MSIYAACFLRPLPLYLDPTLKITNSTTSGGTVATSSIVIYLVSFAALRAFLLGFLDRGSITLTFTALLAGSITSAGGKKGILALISRLAELAIRCLATTE